jgi:alanyl-tRNA synthetase
MPKTFSSLADEGKKKLGSGIVILVASDPEGKAALVVGVTGDLTGTNNAVQMVQAGVASSAARAAAAVPTWRKAAVPMGAPRRRRWPPSRNW